MFFLFSPSLSCCLFALLLSIFFFFTAPSTADIYTLSLHDALPICFWRHAERAPRFARRAASAVAGPLVRAATKNAEAAEIRSEEHTSELQSRPHLVCRLLLEKKKKKKKIKQPTPKKTKMNDDAPHQ